MEKVVGLSSVAVMLALATGGILGNAVGGVPLAILGMILAVPIAASISIFCAGLCVARGLKYPRKKYPDHSRLRKILPSNL